MSGLDEELAAISLHADQQRDRSGIAVPMGTVTMDDDSAERLANVLRLCIERITPIVDDLGNVSDDTGASD